MWLFASYEVSLPRPMLVKTESTKPIDLVINLKGWDAEISLQPSARPGRIRLPGRGWHYPVSNMDITVTRDGNLGDELMHEEVARRMIERLQVFLYYRQRHSLLTTIEHYQQYFDHQAEPIKLSEPRLQLINDFDQSHMLNYLQENFEPELCKALLDDATRSIINQRQRRACIELTMACETALGMRLENAHVAKLSIGNIFAKQHPAEFEQVVQLFHTRDAVQQASNGLFKFISQQQKLVLAEQLTCWKRGVECLATWLNTIERGTQEAI